jgi:hypothetical protein
MSLPLEWVPVRRGSSLDRNDQAWVEVVVVTQVPAYYTTQITTKKIYE